MSMYGLVMGDGGQGFRGQALMTIIDLDNAGRFRDAWVEHDPDREGKIRIAIYTRNGGGNREHWDEAFDAGIGCDCTGCIGTFKLPAHPLYIGDRDDDFDSTYATFYFRVPNEWVPVLAEHATAPVDMDARWQSAIEALDKRL